MLFSALAMALRLTPIIIAHVALTWFSVVRLLAPVAALLETVAEPLVIPNRRRQPPDTGFDPSPLVVLPIRINTRKRQGMLILRQYVRSVRGAVPEEGHTLAEGGLPWSSGHRQRRAWRRPYRGSCSP